jgi:hypothetical protein
LKTAAVAPAATVTLPGTVAFVLLLDRATWKPPLGAAWVKFTVQAEDPGVFTGFGAHETVLTDGVGCTVDCTVITPPVPEAGIAPPRASDATIPLNVTGRLVLVLPVEIVSVAVATTPLAIAVVLIPKTRHVVEPPDAEQERLFPAAVMAELAVMLTFVTSTG